MASVSKSGLSPVAALCLRLIKGWLGVVSRGQGGELRNGIAYTRLKATEVQLQLETEQGVAVSSKTVQRALTELVAGGHLSRRQLYKHRYNRTYWYCFSDAEQQLQPHRPISVAARFQRRTEAGAKSVPTTKTSSHQREDTPVPSILNAQITYSNLKTASKQTAEQIPTEEASCSSSEPRQEVIAKAWGQRAPKPVVWSSNSRLQQAQNALGLLVERAQRFQNRGGSGFRSVETQKPVAFQVQSAQKDGFIR